MSLRFLEALSQRPRALRILWVVALSLAAAWYVDHRLRLMKPPVHPYVAATAARQESLASAPVPTTNRLFILFVDSFRFDYSQDPALMPTLSSLLPESTWGMVKPCTSNMTVHCVETTFSGFDRSSLLSFAEDFHPTQSKNAGAWPFLVAAAGHKVKAICNYVIYRLYKDALADVHFFDRGQEKIDALSLADIGLRWFADMDTDVVLLYTLDAHDAGHKYGTTGPEYRKALMDADAVLRRVVDAASPQDTIMVFGDHGINDQGQHNYAQDVPTFYLYRGPDFVKGVRQDISMFSHRFFLNVLFRLPFFEDYQGETYFELVRPEVAAVYGTPDLLALKRETTAQTFELTWLDFVMAAGLGLLAVGGLVRLRAAPGVGVLPGRGRLRRIVPAVAAAVALLAFLLLKAAVYAPLDGLIHGARLFVWLALYAVYATAGWFLAPRMPGLPPGRTGRLAGAAVTLTLGLFVAHYPTLYGFGSLRGVAIALLVAGLAAAAACGEACGTPGRNTTALVVHWGVVGVLLALIASQYFVFVENFRIVHFQVFPVEAAGWWVRPVSFLALLAAQNAAFHVLGTPDGRAAGLASGSSPACRARIAAQWALAVLVWLVFLQVLPVPGVVQAAVSLAFVLVAVAGCFRRGRMLDRLTLFLLLQLVLCFVYEFGYAVLFQLNAVAAACGLFAAAFRGWRPRAGDLTRPSGAALLPDVTAFLVALLMGLAAFGMRAIGIDFKFASRWFGDAYVSLWFLVFVVTLLKYTAPVLLALLVLRGKEGWSFGGARNLLMANLLLLVPFCLFLLLLRPAPTLVVDTLEELIFMTAILLCFLAASAVVTRYGERGQRWTGQEEAT